MGIGRRHQSLFRQDQPSMDVTTHLYRYESAGTMVESGIRRKGKVIPDDRRLSTRGHYLSRGSQHGPGWSRRLARCILWIEKGRRVRPKSPKTQSALRTLCG